MALLTGAAPDGGPPPTATLPPLRAQNRFLHRISGDYLLRQETRSPAHQALALTLGLAQYQSTWVWPWGDDWAAMLSGDPPGHWLPAYVWHLCWAAGEPGEAHHLERAEEALDRDDSAVLVEALRRWMLVPTSEADLQDLDT